MANLALSTKKSNTTTSATTTSSSSSSSGTTTKQKHPIKRNDAAKYQFPGKLMDFLMYIEQQNLDHIICWVLNGRGFMINDEGTNLVQILPKFFSQTKYRSLRRQLNMWHFQRILDGPMKGAFINPFFQRNNRELLCYMSRQLNFNPIEFESLLSKEQYRSSLTSTSLGSGSSSYVKKSQTMSLSNIMLQNILKSTTAPTETTTTTPNVDSSTFTSSCPAGVVDCQSSSSSYALSQLQHLNHLQLQQQQEHAELTQTVESVLSCTAASSSSSSSMEQQQQQQQQSPHPNDGDMVSFAGKNFFYLDCTDKTLMNTTTTTSTTTTQYDYDYSIIENALETINNNNNNNNNGDDVDSILEEITMDNNNMMFEPNAIFRL